MRGTERGDFRSLTGLGEPGEVCESPGLLLIFQQRIMWEKRPGYQRYMAQLGLHEHSMQTPWQQLIRSGGYWMGDSIRFLPVPEVRSGRVRASFLVHGIRHVPENLLRLAGSTRGTRVDPAEHEQALNRLRRGDRLELLPEPGNEYFADATLVTAGGTPLGYVPNVLTPAIQQLQESATLRVINAGDPGTPPHRRLFVHFDTPAPEGFSFDPEGEWEPIVNEQASR